MNILLLVLTIIVVIVVILLVIALFTKKNYSIQREIIINKPRREVFEYTKLLKNQDYYSKWVMTDPQMKKEYKGTDGTTGFVYAWDGNKKAGKGEQEIKGLVDEERIDIEVRFIRPFEGLAQTPMILESSNANQTKVKWGMSSSMKYPMNIMLVLMSIEKMLGKDLETSLNNLKNILEK